MQHNIFLTVLDARWDRGLDTPGAQLVISLGWSRRGKGEEQKGAMMDIPHYSPAFVLPGKRSQQVPCWGREKEGVGMTWGQGGRDGHVSALGTQAV